VPTGVAAALLATLCRPPVGGAVLDGSGVTTDAVSVNGKGEQQDGESARTYERWRAHSSKSGRLGGILFAISGGDIYKTKKRYV